MQITRSRERVIEPRIVFINRPVCVGKKKLITLITLLIAYFESDATLSTLSLINDRQPRQPNEIDQRIRGKLLNIFNNAAAQSRVAATAFWGQTLRKFTTRIQHEAYT